MVISAVSEPEKKADNRIRKTSMTNNMLNGISFIVWVGPETPIMADVSSFYDAVNDLSSKHRGIDDKSR
jgi:hypothetical protein